jgi:hypothetical protein
MSPAALDLGEEWRARRWRRLLNLIDQLPRTSRYVEALSEDDELAAQVAQRPTELGPPRRLMSEWSADVELLSTLCDLTGQLIQVTVARGGGQARPIRPMPRPVTALQRARDRQRQQKHQSLVSRLLPPSP